MHACKGRSIHAAEKHFRAISRDWESIQSHMNLSYALDTLKNMWAVACVHASMLSVYCRKDISYGHMQPRWLNSVASISIMLTLRASVACAAQTGQGFLPAGRCRACSQGRALQCSGTAEGLCGGRSHGGVRSSSAPMGVCF